MRRGACLIVVAVALCACTAGAKPTAAPAAPTTTTATGPVAMTTTAAAGAETADGRDGGLSVVLTAEPSAGPIGSPVMFTLQATETHAPGALSYRVAYGDGATASNVTPEFCTAGPGPAANQTWSLSHTYAAPGHYSVVATVGVNCSSDTSTITLALNTT